MPTRAILAGTIFGFGAVVMSYVSPDLVFAFLINSYGTVAIFVYLLIAFSELRLRRRLEREHPEKLVLRMWGFPYLTYLAIVGMVGILSAMAFIPDQRLPLALGRGEPGGLMVIYALRRRFRTRSPGLALTRGFRAFRHRLRVLLGDPGQIAQFIEIGAALDPGAVPRKPR